MAYARDVLTSVPRFDPELGPGALGFADDTLFAAQVKEAGYPISGAFHVAVEHHVDESRLSRASWLANAREHARSAAYVAHHWEHREFAIPRLRLAKWRALLATCRARRVSRNRRLTPASAAELTAVFAVALYERYLVERQRPRNYERRGLVRRDAVPTVSPAYPVQRPVAIGPPRGDDPLMPRSRDIVPSERSSL